MKRRIVGKHTRVFRVRRFCRRAGVAMGAAFLWGSIPLLHVGAMAAGYLSATFTLMQAVAFCMSPLLLMSAALVCVALLSAERRWGAVHRIAHLLLRFLPYSGDRRVAELCDNILVFAATAGFVGAALGPASLLFHHPHPLGPMAVISCGSAGALCILVMLALATALWLQFERIDRRSLVANGLPLDIDLDDVAAAPQPERDQSASLAHAGKGHMRQRLRSAASAQEQQATIVGATASTDDEVESSVSSLFLGAPAAACWLAESLRSTLLCLVASVACLAIYAAAGGRLASLYVAVLFEGGWRELISDALFAFPAVLSSMRDFFAA